MRTGTTSLVVQASRRLCALGALLGAVGGAGGCGQDEGGDHSATSHAAVRSQASHGRWLAPNGDLANRRRGEGPITAASAPRLRVAWTVPLSAAYAATPIVTDGVVYTQDLQSNVYAIDLVSGRMLWQKRYEASDIGPNGVNVAGGRVFGATQTAAFALDAKTGKELWNVTLARHPGDAIDMAPGYKDGTVYVSTAVAGAGAVGTLWALDGDSGKPRWKWEQVPAGLWGRKDVNSGGGLWNPPAFDKRGGLYISIANPLPFPGNDKQPWGASRPGPNKWTNSIVKLDAKTGRFLWGRQVLPHDVYDWDLEAPVILATAHGKRVAMTAGKMGFVYEFDASSGALLWKRSVGIHNGHDHDNVLAMRGEGARIKLPTTILPGWWGGVESQMASDGHTVYVPVNNLSILYSSQTRLTTQDPTKGTGEIVALDVATGRVAWDRKLPHSVYGAVTISNDVVFTTTYDGTVWGLRADTGAVVWTSQLPAGTNAPVAVAGDTLLAAASVPLAAEQQPQIVAYRLSGK